MSEDRLTDTEARTLLAILKEINHPTPQPGWIVCSCGCGATRPDDGRIT